MYVERLFLRDGEAVGWFRHKINFRYLDFPKSHLGGGECCLALNQVLSAITFSMLFILYLVAVRSFIASARQNGNWAERTKSHPSSFFLYYGFFVFFLFLGFSLPLLPYPDLLFLSWLKWDMVVFQCFASATE